MVRPHKKQNFCRFVVKKAALQFRIWIFMYYWMSLTTMVSLATQIHWPFIGKDDPINS